MTNGTGIEAFTETAACYEFLQADLPYLGRISPYVFRFPCPVTARQLEIIGRRGAAVVAAARNGLPLHLVGVASRGIPLATAIARHLGGDDVLLSTVGGDGSVEHVARPGPGHFTVVVDNSVVTGATAAATTRALSRIGVRPRLWVRFFDREELDTDGVDPTRAVEARIGCPVTSVFALRDLLRAERRPAERAVLVGYATAHGTASVRAWLGAAG